jgi:secreted trypsin-like serine protease
MSKRARQSSKARCDGLSALVVLVMGACCLGQAAGKNSTTTAKPEASNITVSDKMTGGLEIKRGSHPYLVTIDHRCVGVIIGPRHILTTADCVSGY